MSNYDLILHEFKEIGCEQESKLDGYEMNKALDKIYQKNIKNEQIFNRDISQQIFQQTIKNENQEVFVKDYIKTILEAHRLLNRNIVESKQKVSLANKEEKVDEQRILSQYQADYYELTAPFKIPSNIQQPADSRISKINSVFNQKQKGEQSISLKIILIIALVCFIIQFFLMFIKHHFLTILSIFLLNYFDKIYIRATLYLLLTSILFDLLWVILQADHYWNVNGASQHCSLQQGYLRFIYIMTLLSMIAKGVITLLLYKYRVNSPYTCKSVKLFNLRFDLSSQPLSPLSQIVEKSV